MHFFGRGASEPAPRHTRPTRHQYNHDQFSHPSTRGARGEWKAGIAALLLWLLALPVLGWCVERLMERWPALEQLGTEAHRTEADPLHTLVRARRTETMLSAPDRLTANVLERINALSAAVPAPNAARRPAAPVRTVLPIPSWISAQPWPPLAEGSLARPAGIVLVVLWLWTLFALWASCLLGLTNPTISLDVVEVLVTAGTRVLAILQTVGTLIASAGANLPVTAGVSLLVLVLVLAVWMVIVRQFSRFVLGA